MDWARDLKDWPLNHLSRRIRHRPHDWHVQETGKGATILLLHGAGATTHSWRDVIPTLATHHHVVAVDLPGHGFTRPGSRNRFGLAKTSEDIAELCAAQGWQPSAIVGHSAGGAVALDLSTRLTTPDGGPPRLVGINAALDRFEGVASWLFPALAKMLALNPLTSYAFAMGGARPDRARNVIRSTGSNLSDEALGYYARLLSDREHIDGTLQMMANWNTDALWDKMAEIDTPCLLITGECDKAVPPEVSTRAARELPQGRVHQLSGLGHLAHEEDPDALSGLILDFCDATGR
ncbi:alpha/beta fold hydrolase BchO [Roseovarius aestuariivivens]|uniref:alpha/beta fold hydrolase BchO n=1 Tax=Roseovarius aestuariivivens TaxID=1888910 RepID=UPI001081228B|nr:alpha/beta fold hydrolase BchO [Roseovarius aestuariivivens]